MPGSGVYALREPDRYEAILRRAQVGLIITCGGEFQAHLTSVELEHLQLLRCAEGCARIGYLSLPPLACVSFPADSGLPPTWGGTRLQAGDIMFHSLGERLHESTPGPSIWNLIALDPAALDHYSRVLFEMPLAPPSHGRVLRPARRDAARLRRLHVQAVHLAKTKPKILINPGVAHAFEHDLIEALVTCLIGAKVDEKAMDKVDCLQSMTQFEEVLAQHLTVSLSVRRLCELMGIEFRTLQSCCREFLGINAERYVLLRRLREVRRVLRDADPEMVGIANVASRYGFSEPDRFARAYRAAFRESPSATLGRTGKPRLSR